MTSVKYHPKHNPASLKQSWREDCWLYEGNALGPYVIWEEGGRFEIHVPQKNFIVAIEDTLDGAQEVLQNLFKKWQAATTDYVYFIGKELAAGQPVKIGTTRNLMQRLGQIQSSSPHPVKILGAVEGDRNTELDYHARFAANRLQGEWFELDAALCREIRKAGKLFSAKPSHLEGN